MKKEIKSGNSASFSVSSDSHEESSLNFIISKYLKNSSELGENGNEDIDTKSLLKGSGEEETKKYRVGNRLAKGGMGKSSTQKI